MKGIQTNTTPRSMWMKAHFSQINNLRDPFGLLLLIFSVLVTFLMWGLKHSLDE